MAIREAQDVARDVEREGGELLVLDGLLRARGWKRLPARLQREVGRRYYEVLVLCVQRDSPPTLQHIADIQRWAHDGSLETIGDEIACRPGVLIPAGEAAVRAHAWMRQYDDFKDHSHQPGASVGAHENLQGIHACAVAYWKRRGVAA